MNLVISVIFLDKIFYYMMILLPVFILFTSSLSLVLLRLFRPGFRFNWLIGTMAALLAVISSILWQLKMPMTFSVTVWQPVSIFLNSPNWLVDGYSWPYAVSLTALALSVLSTAVIRKQSNSLNWAGILFITAIGLLSVTSNSPLTLVIVWVALDLSELIILLNAVKAEKSNDLIVSFTVRIASVFFLLWSSIISISSGSPMDFHTIPDRAGILIILAAGLRLGILPLPLPLAEFDLKRGVITVLRLVSAASGLTLLTRIPINSIPLNILPYLIILTGIFSIIGGWVWLISNDEIIGRPFWILCLGSLALSVTLFGNIIGSIAWGSSMILCGGLLFLYTGREKSNYWLPAFGLWGLSTLPFSLTASVWFYQPDGNFLLMVPQLLAHALLLAGFFRHAFSHPGEVDIRLEPRWIQIIYLIGLSILPIMIILIGLWGWPGGHIIGNWWISALTIGLSFLILYIRIRSSKPSKGIQVQKPSVNLRIFSNISWTIYRSLRQVINQISSILEGDGGILWSIVILVLFISLISQITR
jgi:hypothetical protein